MPFTPLHFGPAAAAGWCFRKKIDWFTLLFSNLAVDFEPLILHPLRPGTPEHGLSHSLLGGTGIAVLWAVFCLGAKKAFRRQAHFGNILFSSFLGVYLNALIDAVVYAEIQPFYPLEGNPLYGLLPEPVVVSLCGAATAVWLGIVCYRRFTHGRVQP